MYRLKYTQRHNFLCCYGCETWCLTAREEQRLRLFENWMLLGKFVHIRDEISTGNTQLRMCYEKRHDCYGPPNDQIRRLRWTGNVARVGEETDVYWGLVAKSEGR
jgi:hypothetical protein